MPLTLTAEQQLLRDNASQFIREAAPVGHLRGLRDRNDARGFSPQLWKQMAELGWIGSFLPESYGGLGLGYTEIGLILEACGRTLAPTPFLSSVLLGAGVLLEAGGSQLLQPLAAGDLLLALAFEETPRFAPHHVSCRAERVSGSYRLHGRKTFVLDGGSADKLIVSARTSGAVNDRAGISLFLLDADQRGLTLQSTRTIDSRSVAKCQLEGVEVPTARLVGTLDAGADVLDPVLDRATIALSAELLGLATEAFEITLEYLKTRVQFEVPIGSFQALQHRAVEMFGALELAKSVVQAAFSAVDHNDRRELDVARFASAAKARTSDLARLVTREAIQMHGGIGMTDEHDIGLYLKRSAAAEQTLGDAAYHRDRFAKLSGF